MIKWTCTVGLLLVLSCSHFKSGQYIQISRGETLSKLAKTYKISEAHLLAANKGRNPFSGEWYFIPLKRGILGQRTIASSDNVTESYLNSGEFIWPVPSSKRISSGFGKRWGKHHEGIDIPGKVGSSIISASDGVVVYSNNGIGGYGNLLVISHGGGIFSVYAHAKKTFVRKGQKVFKGQVVAQIGMTGRTTGPHLHFEIRKNSRPVNPIKYVYKNW